jgi:hypothetical protein
MNLLLIPLLLAQLFTIVNAGEVWVITSAVSKVWENLSPADPVAHHGISDPSFPLSTVGGYY